MIRGGTKNSSYGWAGAGDRWGPVLTGSLPRCRLERTDLFLSVASREMELEGATSGRMKGGILLVSLGDSSCKHRGFPQCSQREDGTCHFFPGGDREVQKSMVTCSELYSCYWLHSLT